MSRRQGLPGRSLILSAASVLSLDSAPAPVISRNVFSNARHIASLDRLSIEFFRRGFGVSRIPGPLQNTSKRKLTLMLYFMTFFQQNMHYF